MRRILVEAARRKKCLRHGGGLRRAELPADGPAVASPHEDVIAVHEALEKLSTADDTPSGQPRYRSQKPAGEPVKTAPIANCRKSDLSLLLASTGLPSSNSS